MRRDADAGPTPPSPPERLGPFRVEGVLGRGGMGVVYRARSPEDGPVAVKVVRASLATDGLRRRFEREARVRIDHPNIVRVLDSGADAEGTPFIAFELLEGESLAERLRRGSLAPAEVVDLGVQVCRGLAAAHAQGVVHRDLKPSNLFCCDDGTVKLLDFGVALLDSTETRLTQKGGVVGTLEYLSPEQVDGSGAVDARTDLWSLGAVLYEALAGCPPFRQESAIATVVAILMSDLPPLRDRVPSAPAALASVIERALARALVDRWADATSLGNALEAAKLDEPAARDRSAPASIPPGEERLVAVLFARGVRDARAVQESVRREGGVAVPLVGHRLVGVFGAQTTSGDEVLRAAAAAVRARRAAEQVAVSAGRASAASGGIAGAALDAAESACGSALEGVAIHAEAARSLPSTTALHPVSVDLWELPAELEALDDIGLAEATSTVGRAAELAQVRRAADHLAVEGTALVVLVTGPQGIGKSHLSDALQRQACLVHPQATVLRGRAESHRRGQGWALWGTVLADRLGRRRASAEALIRLVGNDLGDDPQARRRGEVLARLFAPQGEMESLEQADTDLQLIDDRIRTALIEWLEGLCNRAPVVLVVEDLQWADDRSLHLLDDALDYLAGAPLLVMASARPEGLEGRGGLFAGKDVLRIGLRGLSREEVAELIEELTGRRPSDALLGRVAERTAGNPFFVRQVIRALEETEGLTDASGDLPVPWTVEAAVQSRLDHLPPADKELCKRAAVYGRPFTIDEIRALGVAEADRRLRSLRERDLVASRRAPGGVRRYQFRSTLVADVAYRMITEDVRASLHRKAADHLETEPASDPEEVATHCERAGATADAAARYAAAGRRAVRQGDAQTVLRCTGRALALGVADDERFGLHMARAEALRFLGRRQDQAAELEQAAGHARRDADLARVLAEQCATLRRAGRVQEALDAGQRAVRSARAAGDGEVLSLALGRRFLALLHAGEVESARDALEEASTAAAAAGERMRALALGWRAELASVTGDLGARRDAYAELAALHHAQGDLRRAAGAESNLADVDNRIGAHARAAMALRTAREGCRKVGHRAMEGYALLNLGYALTGLGQTVDALVTLDEAAGLAESIEEARLALLVEVYRARALAAAERPEEAAELARAAAERALDREMPTVRVGALTVAARAALALGRPAEALALSTQALALRDELGGVEEDEAEVFVVHARALRDGGRADEADRIVERGRERLTAIAAGIGDADLRAAFLGDVAVHRELMGPTGP